MNTFKQKLPFPLSFKIYKNTAFIALKKIIINQGIKSNFCYHFFGVIAIRLIILAARFQKQSNMFFLIFQILKFHFKKKYPTRTMAYFPDYYNLYPLPTLQSLTTVYKAYLRHVTCGGEGGG